MSNKYLYYACCIDGSNSGTSYDGRKTSNEAREDLLKLMDKYLCNHIVFMGIIKCSDGSPFRHIPRPNDVLGKRNDTENWNRETVWRAIHELSDIRAGYNIFNEAEYNKYSACSLAIKALREVIGEPVQEEGVN